MWLQAPWLSALALLLPCSFGTPNQDRIFKYRSYRETHSFFEQLQEKYPNLVELWYAQDIFPEILPRKITWGTCEGEPCKTLIVRIANKRLLTNSTPEVFFSGALHGDERLGPATVTELASFLCEEYGVDTQVRRLVDFRATWIMPMTNAFGYAAHRREENSMDPNRDFPYLHTRPERCMQTQTARAVNELFRRHLFQFMITFHGGMRALTYEWGSRNHMTMPQRRSTEPPDETAFREVGQAIQAAAGKTLHRRWFYPLGRINDLVYPVEGGMEDWSYAAGWEKSPTPITVCKPNTYGGYAEERTKYRRDSISTLVYLAEMDNYKTAPDNSLGHRLEIWSPSATNGHIARNLRMCLKTIEMTRPEVVVLPPSMPSSAGDGATSLSVQIYGFGCHQMTARLVAVPSSVVPGCLVGEDGGDLEQEQFQQILQKSVKMDATEGHCRGLSLWNASTPPPRVLQGAVPTGEEVCVLIAAEFDQQWARQTRPDPLVTPRSHAARGRLEERYQVKANDGPMMIKARRTKLFAVGGPIRLEATSATTMTAKDTVDQPALAISEETTMATSDPHTSLGSSIWQQARLVPTTTFVNLHPRPEEPEDVTYAQDFFSIAAISFALSIAMGCAMLLRNRQEVAIKANVKDAQTRSELAEMVGKDPI
ncbi:unnamed protein product [Durusdinium trenchii]|uniref:Peptidase M14 domain-containing protein n=1 Tax=Durusdinium trenchii TaxID=1381693 RepID=A0ABP0P359_9DINO